jgi:hypothetical protein
MAPKAFETSIYALGTAFGVSQPHATGTVDHLHGTFTLPDSTASQRNLAQQIRRKTLPWNQGCINPRKRKSGNHPQLHVDINFGFLKQDTGRSSTVAVDCESRRELYERMDDMGDIRMDFEPCSSTVSQQYAFY